MTLIFARLKCRERNHAAVFLNSAGSFQGTQSVMEILDRFATLSHWAVHINSPMRHNESASVKMLVFSGGQR